MLAPDSRDTHSLIRVMPHGKVIDYASSDGFVNEALGWSGRNEAALDVAVGHRPSSKDLSAPGVVLRCYEGKRSGDLQVLGDGSGCLWPSITWSDFCPAIA
jgi:hypothetical protein